MDAVSSITSENQGKTYEIPESCIGSAKDARTTISSLVEAESTRAKRRAKFNGMLNGNPPWPGLLRNKGQGDRANFTLREAEGFIAAAKTPYYALAFKADRFIQLTLDYASADLTLLAEWAGKIATRYQYANEDDDSLDMHMQRSQFQMVAHGSGPMVWEDNEDWHAKSRMAGQILVPDDASADIDEWDTVACPRSYTPTQLWAKIKNEAAATARKWNVPACKKAIMDAAPDNLKSTYGSNFEYYEAEMRKGSTGWDSKSKRIFVTDLFQKEFTNRISHFIVLKIDEATVETDKEGDPSSGFLFRKIGRYESWSQIICPFLYDVGPDGQWHSVKGAGPKIFDFCSASDRLFCRGLDGAMRASGVIIQAKDANALQEVAFTDVSGGTVIGPKYEVMQQRVAPNLESPLLMKRELGKIQSENTGQYRQRWESEPEPTYGQQQMKETRESVLGDFDASRYMQYLDRFHRERFRRILAMGKKLYASRKDIAPVDIENETTLTKSEQGALKFYRSCVVTDGIPEEIMKFENFCRIKATRLVGNGSIQMRQMIGDKMLGLVTAMDERGRNFTLRSVVSSYAGETWADATFPAYGTPQIVDSHESLAQLENNFLRMPGGKVLIDPSQNHSVHFQSHIADVSAHADETRQGGDPMALMIHLEQAGPHLHEHLFAIQGDPTRKAEVQEMMKAWMAMSEMADQLKQQLEEATKAQAANQPQQAPDPELIAKLAKVHGELGIKREKVMGDLQLKAEKQRVTLRQKDISLAHEMKVKEFQARQPEMAA